MSVRSHLLSYLHFQFLYIYIFFLTILISFYHLSEKASRFVPNKYQYD